jgi:hypothetical protein
MKDFDSERQDRHSAREKELGDREFKLGGKTFNYRANTSYTVLESIAAVGEAEGGKVIELLEAALSDLVEADQAEAFLAVLRDKKDVVTFEDMNSIVNWIVEEQTKRPLSPASASTDGDATTGTSSKVAKSSGQATLAVN